MMVGKLWRRGGDTEMFIETAMGIYKEGVESPDEEA